MSANSFGNIFKLTSFGESHGLAIGGVIEGFPAGITIDIELIKRELAKRKPGSSKWVSQRKEDDEVEILSGVFEGKSLGTPIGFIIRNKDARSKDYSDIKNVYRPSHADYSWDAKYGIRDYRGGGRSSARETVARVVAGAFAQHILNVYDIEILSWVNSIGSINAKIENQSVKQSEIDASDLNCPEPTAETKMKQLIEETSASGDSLGGTISCIIRNCPTGLGEPVFNKMQANLAHAMLSINAVKGFEYGSGFASTEMKGSEHNDIFVSKNGKISTQTNNSGGVQGGISNGEDITFKVAFKPVATIAKEQQSIDKEGVTTTIKPGGRHDACVVPRAVPIVRAMAAMVIADMILLNRSSRI